MNNNTDKKYELVKENYIKIDDHTLYRIRALKDIDYFINKGDLGGYIEKEDNLSQEGLCWVYDDAKVYDNAMIYDDATVFDNAKVYDNAIINNNVEVFNNVEIFDNATVSDNAKVFDNSKVFNETIIDGNAKVFDNSIICGNAKIYGDTRICDNAYISSNDDYISIVNIGSEYSTFTAYKTKDKDIIECTEYNKRFFKGTLQEFEKYIKEKYDNTKYKIECKYIIKLANIKLLSPKQQ